MSDHLYSRGLLQGRHSDITVHVFGKSYQLHRIILDRAPFFYSASSGPWLEATSKDIDLHPEDIDTNITQISFELALKRLYGCNSDIEEDAATSALFATGCWLEMQDLIDASVDAILRKMQMTNLAPILQLVMSNYYGRPGDKILVSAKAMLSRDGWLMPLRYWDDVPSELVREVVAADGFFVHGEWERFVLTKRLLNRRIKAVATDMRLWGTIPSAELHRFQAGRPTPARMLSRVDDMNLSSASEAVTGTWRSIYEHESVEPLLRLLDEGVHYIHMTFEQLQEIRSARDTLGFPLVSEKIIADALWSSLELRQKVVNAQEKELTLDLSHHSRNLSSAGPPTQLSSSNATTTGSGKQRAVEVDTTSLADTRDLRPIQTPRYWIPSADCNIVVGSSSENAQWPSSHVQQHATRLETSTHTSQDVPLSLDAAIENMSPCDAQPTCYTNFPPFRFAAEFPRPRALRYKERVYSRTVFYAGSFWNVYIQKVKSASKITQLGIYLHRAKSPDTESRTGRAAVDERIDALEHEMSVRKQQRLLRWSSRSGGRTFLLDRRNTDRHLQTDTEASRPRRPVSSDSRNAAHLAWGGSSSTMPQVTISHETTNEGENTTHATSSSTEPAEPDMTTSSDDEGVAKADSTRQAHHPSSSRSNPTLAPYADARPTVKAYFKIFSPSRGGRSLSVYESAPDTFNFSQCWGWRSTDLMKDDSDEDDEGSHADDYNAALQAAMRATATRSDEETERDELVSVGGDNTGGTDELLGVVGDAGLDAGGQPKERKNLRFMIVLGVV